MKKLRSLFLGVVAALALTALLPTAAGAEPLFRYDVELGSYAQVDKLNPTLATTIRVMHGATQLTRSDWAVGSTSAYAYSNTIQPGDVVEIYQGAAHPPTPVPPGTPVTESYTVPMVTLNAAAGSPSVSGVVPAGSSIYIVGSVRCEDQNESVNPANSGGAYSASFSVAAEAGSDYNLTSVEPDGDMVRLRYRVPGDAGCLYVDASSRQYGFPADSFPYQVSEAGLDNSVSPTTRIVLRRGGTIIADKDSTSLNLTPDQKPLPGDVVEVYRPKEAAAPVRAHALPAYGAIVDTGNDMVAIDSPAALQVEANTCTQVVCAAYSSRAALNVPNGRTLFSFAQPLGDQRAVDIAPTDQVGASWLSPDSHMQIYFDAVPGDLTSPIGKITLAKKLKLRKIGKKIKFKINSTEAGTAVCTFTTPPPGKAKQGKKGKSSAKKPVTLATAKATLKAGTNTVSLKVTKKGKKSIKKIIASRKSQTGTLTITLTDASGNATTVVKSTKLALK